MSQVRFYIRWTVGKGIALTMPSGFAELFPVAEDEV